MRRSPKRQTRATSHRCFGTCANATLVVFRFQPAGCFAWSVRRRSGAGNCVGNRRSGEQTRLKLEYRPQFFGASGSAGVRSCGSIGYRSPVPALYTVRARHFCGRSDACACPEDRIQTGGATSGSCSTGRGSFRAKGLRFIGANFGVPIPRLRFERRIAALAIVAFGEQICDWSASGGGCGDCCFRPSALAGVY